PPNASRGPPTRSACMAINAGGSHSQRKSERRFHREELKLPRPELFTPIDLGGVTLPNRIVISPMCQYSADDGSMTDWHLIHLGHLAYSGAGLMILEATHVTREGRITHGCSGLYSDNNEQALLRVIQHCRTVRKGP